MLQILINFVFNIVTSIVQAFTSPFVNIILSIFPNLTVELAHVVEWFGLAFQYVTCVYRWFLFTPAMFVLLFDYFAVKFSIWLISSSVRMAIKFYNTFKP